MMDNRDIDKRVTDLVIEAYKKDVDITLLRENLKLSYTERFKKLTELLRFASELKNAKKIKIKK